ncbi:MAG: SEL1-like repeat protein, partial [Alphaproteobacteria bacterium]
FSNRICLSASYDANTAANLSFPTGWHQYHLVMQNVNRHGSQILRISAIVVVLWLILLTACPIGMTVVARAQDETPANFHAAYAAYTRGDYQTAHDMWLVLAKRGDADAQFNVAALYDNGWGIERDIETAARWYERAAARNIAPAELALAHILRHGEISEPDGEQALRHIRSAAHRGSARAQFELGVAYDRGVRVTQNYATAAVWYEKAAAQGLTEAIYNLGTLFDEGLGAPKDHAAALAWYRQAARGGNALAENNIGNLHEKGLGVPQDYAQAVEWYAKAAARGLAIAQNNLAIMYHLGHGVARDFKQAARWYRLAAAQGEQSAQNNLGLLQANGLGVARDLMAATKWFLLAAGGPDKDLALRASTYSRRLAAELVGDELAAVQDAVDAYNAAAAMSAETESKRLVPVPASTEALGHQTVTLQRLLAALGYYQGAVDGLIGPITLEALRLARRREGLDLPAEISAAIIAALADIHRRRSPN